MITHPTLLRSPARSLHLRCTVSDKSLFGLRPLFAKQKRGQVERVSDDRVSYLKATFPQILKRLNHPILLPSLHQRWKEDRKSFFPVFALFFAKQKRGQVRRVSDDRVSYLKAELPKMHLRLNHPILLPSLHQRWKEDRKSSFRSSPSFLQSKREGRRAQQSWVSYLKAALPLPPGQAPTLTP